MKRKQVLILFFILLVDFSKAANDNLVQLSGIVVTSDSLMAIPYVNIIIKNSHRGTISDFQGFFSFVTQPGDTVLFSCVGFKRKQFIVPDTLNDDKYSVIQLLTRDTIYLDETIIYPWPTRDQFRNAFLNTDVPDDDLERARKNLEREKLKELGESVPYDPNENVDWAMRQHAASFYSYGQYPSINLFNPFAWAQFIKAWKRGDYKRKK